MQAEDRIEVRENGKYGKGVFATTPFQKGETIRLFDGEVISLEEDLRRVASGELRNDDPLQIDDELFLVLDPISYLFNHSCQPNAGIRGRSELFALRSIENGEEITYDYSTTVGPNVTSDLWTMPCRCGQASCRKILSNVLSIPTSVLENYMALGAFQDYILRHLKAVKH